MRILRAADHKRMPWKNGGGETVEVAVFPENAALGDFDWRVSMAIVAVDGPFSIFPGIDRTISILSGGGMNLTPEGGEAVLLTQQREPFAFPADASVMARLEAGPITDLNVMTRRGAFSNKMERLHVRGNRTITIPAAISLLLCYEGDVAFELDSKSGALGCGDALMIEARAGATLDLIGTATCYRIAITSV